MFFDFTDPLLQTDRHEYYRRFRERDPIHWTPYGYWMLFRYDDADDLLRSPHTSSNFPANHNWTRARGGPASPMLKSASKWVLLQDDAGHRRLRRVLGKLFSRRMIDRLRVRAAQIVDRVFDEIGDGEVEVMSQLALPLPLAIVSELLGVPEPDRRRYRAWSDAMGHMIDRSVSPERLIAANRAEPMARAYVLELIEQVRERVPEDTLISLMTHGHDEHGEPFGTDEIAANIALVFNAGHETTTNLIGNGILALLRQPDAMQALRDDPSLMTTAVEELSRFEPSARFAARILTADTKVGDTVIPAGECVFVAFDAVGRDPDRYPDPDRLDLARTGVKSLAFSAGPHHCMGKTLATVEAGTLFGELLRRYRTIELACDDPPYGDHFNLRTLANLPIRLAH